MNIGVDATCWLNKRGYGRHARCLLRALVDIDRENHYTFVVDWQTSDRVADDNGIATGAPPLPAGVTTRVVASSAPTAVAAAADGRRSVRDLWRMSRVLSDPEFDVVLFPSAYSYAPVVGKAKVVIVVHDVIADIYPRMTLPTPSARLFWRAKMWLARRRADALLTVSDFSREAMARRFSIDANKIFVVGEAPDPVFRRLDAPVLTPQLVSLGLERASRNVVYVGGFGPHKNLEMLLREFEAVLSEADLPDVTLILVGEYEQEVFHSTHESLMRLADELLITDRVVFAGFLPDADLVALLNCAAVLVLPSLMEGFGLPAIEAAACGCPVIATQNSPLPELLAGAGEFFDPRQPGDLAAMLGGVLESPDRRARMSEAGIEATARLSWEHSARQLLDVMSAVAGS